MNLQSSTTIYRPIPSPFKHKFQELGIRAGAVAVYISRSYPLTLNYLNGVCRIPDSVKAKMEQLVEEIQSKNA